MLDITYSNKTESKFLNKIKEIKIKGYDLIKTEDNFFIWKRKNKGKHYKRLCLIRSGFQDKTLFYWNYEPDFKPFSKKENINIKGESFKFNETEKFYNYFLNMLDKIKKERV